MPSGGGRWPAGGALPTPAHASALPAIGSIRTTAAAPAAAPAPLAGLRPQSAPKGFGAPPPAAAPPGAASAAGGSAASAGAGAASGAAGVGGPAGAAGAAAAAGGASAQELLDEVRQVLRRLQYDTHTALSVEQLQERLPAMGYRLLPSEVR